MAVADKMVELNLTAAGYEYLNIDDWSVQELRGGRISLRVCVYCFISMSVPDALIFHAHHLSLSISWATSRNLTTGRLVPDPKVQLGHKALCVCVCALLSLSPYPLFLSRPLSRPLFLSLDLCRHSLMA